MLDAVPFAQECAQVLDPARAAQVLRVARTESSFNPFAIGVVGGRLERQPTSKAEALATASALEKGGWNFSLGLLQVNRYNLPKYEVGYPEVLDVCTNIRVAASIFEDCLARAPSRAVNSQQADREALSCYYSGNFTRGLVPDAPGKASYVDKVLADAQEAATALRVIPNKGVDPAKPPQRDRAVGVVKRSAPPSAMVLKSSPIEPSKEAPSAEAANPKLPPRSQPEDISSRVLRF